MSKVRHAILRGTQAAARLHRDYGLRVHDETRSPRVDVFDLIVKLDIPLLFKPLDTLLGVFLLNPMAGIMVTTKRPLTVQRLTGAHELGHYCLNHKPSIDSVEILRRSPFDANASYDIQEIEADAFAVELILPRWLVAMQLHKQGWSSRDMQIPSMAYQLSLRLGASYDATCRALERYKIIAPSIKERLLKIRPQSIKEELLRGHEEKAGWSDVWLLSEHDQGSVIEGGKTDLFILKLREHSGAGYLWNFEQLNEANFVILKDERLPLSENDYGGDVTRWIAARSTASHSGQLAITERRPWIETGEPLSSLRFEYDLCGPETEGLSKAERRQLWGVA